MKLSDTRLAAMIARDPVAISYTISGTTVTTTGLLHRGQSQRAKSDDEQGAGRVERQDLRLLLRAVDVAASIPVEGTPITVAAKAYRCAIPEMSPDQSHYIITLMDANG